MQHMVLNELSLNFPVENISDASSLMYQFLKVYQYGVRMNLSSSVLLSRHLDGMTLCKGYHIEQWRNDPRIDIETKRMYRSFNDKAQFEFMETHSEQEFVCTNGSSLGCLLAYKHHTIAISFNSLEDWNTSLIRGKLLDVESMELYGSSGQDVEVLNVSNVQHFDVEHLKLHIQSNLEADKKKLSSGKELWELKESMFPNLLFCENTEQQIVSNLGNRHLSQIIKKLIHLESYFSSWNGRAFDKKKLLNVDPQSTETLQRYPEDHSFITPTGTTITASWHIRFTGDIEGRIYFDPDNDSKTCLICHVGLKLPTVSWPNP